jgi:Cation efflux family
MGQVLIDRTSRIEAIELWAISPAPSASRVLASDCSLDSGVMSLVSSSARVVYAALAGNLAVAAAKFGAAALSGSTAMLTEAIHSLVDSADQLLLLTGQSRARKSPDRTIRSGMAWKPISGPSSLPYSSFS